MCLPNVRRHNIITEIPIYASVLCVASQSLEIAT